MAEGAACASQTIASFFASFVDHRDLSSPNRLAQAAQDANRAVYEVYRGRGGATLSAVLLDGPCCMTGVNIGDSRIYSFRNNRVEQLTADDTMAGRQPEENIDLCAKYELLQHIGMGDGMMPRLISNPLPWEMVILSSDGAHCFDEGIMQMVLQNTKEPGAAAKSLIEIARWCGGFDNASIAIARPVIAQQQLLDYTGLIQAWDPFGELQIFVPDTGSGGEVRKESLKAQRPVEQKKPQQNNRAAKAPGKTRPESRNGKKAVVDRSNAAKSVMTR